MLNVEEPALKKTHGCKETLNVVSEEQQWGVAGTLLLQNRNKEDTQDRKSQSRCQEGQKEQVRVILVDCSALLVTLITGDKDVPNDKGFAPLSSTPSSASSNIGNNIPNNSNAWFGLLVLKSCHLVPILVAHLFAYYLQVEGQKNFAEPAETQVLLNDRKLLTNMK